MSEKVETLQEVINKRAFKRLDEDLDAIHQFISNNAILSRTWHNGRQKSMPTVGIKKGGEGKEVYIPFLFHPSSEFRKSVREYWEPEYIAEETRRFVNEVEKVRQDVDYLLDNVGPL